MLINDMRHQICQIQTNIGRFEGTIDICLKRQTASFRKWKIHHLKIALLASHAYRVFKLA
jgi:hypothetical protein